MQKKLKIGHIYAIDWLDHFFTDRIRADAQASPVVNRTYGMLTSVGPQYLRLEFCRQISDESPSATVSYFEILHSDLVGVTDLGTVRKGK